MFCHKCGSNIADGASFCHKCGAKMTSGDTTVQTPNTSAATSEPRSASISTKPKQPQTHDVPSGTSKKKKWGKLPIILGAVALVIVLISIVASSDKVSDFLQNQGNVTLTTSSGMETVKLSQTYTNEAEGFSFKYPSDWTVMKGTELYNTTHDDSAVVCLYAPEGFGAASNILVNKTQADYSLFDYTKTDFEQLFAPMFDEVSVTDLSNINIDGFSVIKLELAIKEGTETLLVDRYYYIIGNFTYVMSGTTRQSAIDSDGPVVDVIMDSYTITAASAPEESETATATYFVELNESYSEGYEPAIMLYQDGRFSFLANMGEGVGFYNGTYSVNGGVYSFNVTETEFSGNKSSFEFAFAMRPIDDTLVFESDDTLGLTMKGAVFSLCDAPPKSIINAINDKGTYEGDDGYADIPATVTATDFVGTYSYDASFEDPNGGWVNHYYLLEIGLDGSDLVVTQTWRGNYLFDHVKVSQSSITGNTLAFDAITYGSTEPQTYSLTYIQAKDSPSKKDTIYIDGNETMPFVRE